MIHNATVIRSRRRGLAAYVHASIGALMRMRPLLGIAACALLSSCDAGTSSWKQVASEVQLTHPTREYDWKHEMVGSDLHLNTLYVSNNGQQLWAIGANGTALRSVDGGKQWVKQVLQIKGDIIVEDLSDIFASGDGSTIWIIGTNGLLTSRDYGSNWTRPYISDAPQPGSITGTDDGHELWMNSGRDTILHSGDAGTTWNVLPHSDRFYTIHRIRSNTSGSQLWLIAGVPSYTSPIYVSADRGKTWKEVESLKQAKSIRASDDGTELWATTNLGNAVAYSNNRAATWATIIFTIARMPVDVGTSPDGNTVWVLGDDGDLEIGHAVGHYAEIAQARLRSSATRAYLDFIFAPTQNTLSSNKDSIILDVDAADAFNANHRDRYADPRDNLPQSRIVRSPPNSNVWQVDFDPANVGVKSGESIHMVLTLMQGNSTQAYGPVVFTYQSFWYRHRQWLLPSMLIASVLLCFAFLLLFYPLGVLRLYQRLPLYELLDQVPAGSLGSPLKLLAKATVLPFLITNERVLDAWVNKHASSASQHFAAYESFKARAVYLTLPVSVGDLDRGVIVTDPHPSVFRHVFAARPSVVDICGSGGSGKSTLAFQMAQWAIADDPEQRLARHKMLPILIEDNFSNIGGIVRNTVSAWFGEEVDAAFVKALLRSQRILIVVDGVSERDQATRRYLTEIHGVEPVNALISTSRHETPFINGSAVRVYPLPLTEGSVLHFATGVIRARGGVGLLNIDQQIRFVLSLAHVVSRQGVSGTITPLLVTLAVAGATERLEQGRDLGELPTSIAEVYFEYVRRLNHSTADPNSGLEAAECLGQLALGAGFVAGEFSGRRAREMIKSDSGAIQANGAHLARFVENGVLIRRLSGTDEIFRFVLDPLAEMLAAVRWARDCGSDVERWRELVGRVTRLGGVAAGFGSALRVVHATYWREQDWASPDDVWPGPTGV